MADMRVDATRASALLREILETAELIHTEYGPVIAAPVTWDLIDHLFAASGSLDDREPDADTEHSVQFAHALDFFRSPYSNEADRWRLTRRCVAPRVRSRANENPAGGRRGL